MPIIKGWIGKTGILLAMVALGFYLGKGAGNVSADNRQVREKSSYSLINPLLICDISVNQESTQLKSLEKKVQTIINDYANKELIRTASVYYRDLKKASWFGVNENERYTPASLLKVPIMIAYLRSAAGNPAILDKSIAYTGNWDDNRVEYFKPKEYIQPGQGYTVQKLIDSMIVNSDNNAERLLNKNINQSLLKEVYTDLGITFPTSETQVDSMSAKLYSYFFRILYNASYLSRESSQKALQILTQSTFDQGLRAGVPKDVLIAHKFGESTLLTPTGEIISKELHDCGIIYFPEKPYLLCVMTRGDDFNSLAKIIRNISTTIYVNNFDE